MTANDKPETEKEPESDGMDTGKSAPGTSCPRPKKGRRPSMGELAAIIDRNGGVVRAVARACGVTPKAVRKWRVGIQGVEEMFYEASEKVSDQAESNVIRAVFDPTNKNHFLASLSWLNNRARDRGWGKPVRPTDAPRHDREGQDSFIKSKISDPEVQSAANALLKTLNDPSVPAPMDEKNVN